jgi:hypothetical protein
MLTQTPQLIETLFQKQLSMAMGDRTDCRPSDASRCGYDAYAGGS